MRARRAWLFAPLSLALAHAAALAQTPPLAASIVGDGIPHPLSTTPGDAARGRAIVANRQLGLCLLCHTAPIAEERFQGDLGPGLAGAGKRWSEAQLRLRVADSRALNPASVMPRYAAPPNGARVGAAWQGKPILSPQQIEDVVAWLRTLQD